MKCKGIGSVLKAILVGVMPALAAGAMIHVDDDAPLGGDGMSWATAHRYLQDGLASAQVLVLAGPTEIRVARGIYTPDRSEAHPETIGERRATFELTGGVSLAGGYAGVGAADPNRRDIAHCVTILSGDLACDDVPVRDPNRLEDEPTRADNCHHVVTVTGPGVLDGVTISGGHAWGIPELHLESLDLMGAGLFVTGADLIVRECLFEANLANEGGAVYAEDSNVLLTRCTLARNGAVIRGGAICSHTPRHVELANCLLIANMAVEGGAALSCDGGLVEARNCTTVANGAPEGRFLLDLTGRPPRGASAPWIVVQNCILADGGNEISNGYAALTIHYSDVLGGRSAVSDPQRAMVWGAGNLDVDPCFADAGYWDPNDDSLLKGDYHLKSLTGRWDPIAEAWAEDDGTSPCIDAGNPATPFEQEPSPHGNRINMGAYGGTSEASKSDATWWFATTQGPILAEGLGLVLPHEHIFTDLRGPTSPGYGQGDPVDVVRVMKPFLVGARQAGVGVLVECTSIGVGRNVDIIERVAHESGLPVVVPTGVYGRDSFAPLEHRNMTEGELTALFIGEIREGIDGTGIKAGFIKTATGSGAMTPLEEKFLRAAGHAARETGAAVASHTPLGANATRQATILESIDPAIRFIWVHAQNESNRDLHRQLAARGVFIEFDSLGWDPGQDSTLVAAIKDLLTAGYGDRILLSHDAGWYQPGQPNGGSQKPYTYLIDTFIPKLRSAGVDGATIRMITETNPIRAFAFKVVEKP